MFKSALKGSKRGALIGILAAVMVAASATAASAAVGVSPSSGIAWTGAQVTVKAVGAAPTGTTHVAAVVCNSEGSPGTRCDAESGTPGFISIGQYEAGYAIPVQRGPWVDFDFTKGTPPTELETTTECYSAKEAAGSACIVAVSFYQMTEKGPKQLGADWASISFE
jgi:hypothetical protein